MRKRIMASIAAGFLIVSALASPASAGWDHDHHHDGPDDCPRHAVCFWEKPHFKGDMDVVWKVGHKCHEAEDHKIGSVVNNTHRKIKLYKDDDCDHKVDVVHAWDWDKHVHAKSWKGK
ncbi:peptidase inhibitor family I36 protein [Glycomyces albidus]|jgi:hypothetical protein|nr:peptidase inhibitor family I36 protein [Glycomyces albidus]